MKKKYKGRIISHPIYQAFIDEHTLENYIKKNIVKKSIVRYEINTIKDLAINYIREHKTILEASEIKIGKEAILRGLRSIFGQSLFKSHIDLKEQTESLYVARSKKTNDIIIINITGPIFSVYAKDFLAVGIDLKSAIEKYEKEKNLNNDDNLKLQKAM